MSIFRAEDYLGEDGLFSSSMDDFEFRPEQVEMCEAVGHALGQGHPLIVEAGTGTGKSLAYLVPAILWAVKYNQKVIISTYTKTLQNQILHHDIPFLIEHLGVSFRYALCLGHENYLSLRRLKRAGQAGLFTKSEEEGQLHAIFDWAGETRSGLRSDLPFEPLPVVWEDVGRQKDLCMGKSCETYSSCFYFRERKKWFSAHLLIVNHHLFFANVASGGAVLPGFDAVIFDEAQNIEEVATNFLGLEIANAQLFYFLDRLHNPRTKKGALSKIQHDLVPHVRNLVALARQAVELFFEKIFEEYGKKDRVLRFYNPPVIDNILYIPLQELYESLKTLESRLDSEEDKLEITSAANRCFEFNNALTAYLNQHMQDYVYWLEITARKRFPRVTLKGVPIDVSEELQEQVFNKVERIVMTSATLTTNKNFDFIKNRTGYQPNEELVLATPFDYPSQALLYIPEDLPLPNSEPEPYFEALANRCRELILAAEGKTFVLFTSYQTLNQVYEQLEFLGNEYQLLKQGDLSPNQMIARFKEIPSVIFGTNSFWQGVDIPGESLKSVIITKLPFDVPSEPLTEARMEALRKSGIDPFRHYQIPRAIIQLKQGFGRLIRKKSDTGVVSILDSRMVHRSYGKQFLASLPDCKMSREIKDVRDFLQGTKTGELKI